MLATQFGMLGNLKDARRIDVLDCANAVRHDTNLSGFWNDDTRGYEAT